LFVIKFLVVYFKGIFQALQPGVAALSFSSKVLASLSFFRNKKRQSKPWIARAGFQPGDTLQ